MELSKRVKINHPKFEDKLECEYAYNWNGIPIYYTDKQSNVYSILTKDGSCLIVVSRRVLDLFQHKMIEIALWHEVSHLYYKDCLLEWSIEHEYRADKVAAYATSLNEVISSLELARVLYKSDGALNILTKRTSNLLLNDNELEINPIQMLESLRPVNVR